MATPSSRQSLIDYSLRELGHPVIEINVDDDQLEDRVDEAIQFYREFHYDSTEFFYLKQQVTPSTLTLSSAVGANFTTDKVITGSTSGATAKIHDTGSSTLSIYDIAGDFVTGETITGDVSHSTATIASGTFLVKGNYDNQYFDISTNITGVIKVLPLTSRSAGVSMFDVRYQLMLNNIQSLTSTDVVYYSQLKTHINLINDLMSGQKPIRFNRHMNRLYVDWDWHNDVAPGDYIIAECYRVLDPDTYTDVYNDMFLKKYLTSLIKKQWGTNLKKFEGVQMPGGVILNGQKIYDEAVEELSALKEEVQLVWQLPVDMFVG